MAHLNLQIYLRRGLVIIDRVSLTYLGRGTTPGGQGSDTTWYGSKLENPSQKHAFHRLKADFLKNNMFGE